MLSAEQPLLAQQSLDADLDARELALSIDLVRALGGGYEAIPLPQRRRDERVDAIGAEHKWKVVTLASLIAAQIGARLRRALRRLGGVAIALVIGR